MKKYISEYLDEMKSFITSQRGNPDAQKIDAFLETFSRKIAYFMHERLIHLIVTVLFAILEIMSFLAFVISANLTVIALCVLFLVLLIPYVFHYYFLENSVQEMYKLEDELRKIRKKIS